MKLMRVSQVNADESFAFDVDNTLVRRILAIAKNDNEGHSFNYHVDEMLRAGIKAKERSLKYAEETRLSRKFSERIAADPTIAADPIRLASLMRECKIGATKVEMSEVASDEVVTDEVAA